MLARSEEWRGQLTVDDYIARELMVSQDSAMSAGHQCWVLVPEDAPIDIRCATESWLQEVIWCPPGETKVVHRPALMFVSLYVPLEHRGQGYGHMMQQYVHPSLTINDTV